MIKVFQEFDHNQGYFELVGENGIERRTFHVVKGYSYERWISEDYIVRFQKELRDSLPDQAEIHWRHRPEINQEKDPHYSWRYTVYMRVTTHPELPETFWQKWERKEGTAYERIYP